MMNSILERCLEDLEGRIDPEVEGPLQEQWIDFAEGRFEGALFMPRRSKRSACSVDWPQVSINEGLKDPDMMALQQFGMCSAQLAAGLGSVLNVRCNYGTSIIPLLFGVELFVMDEETHTLPTSRPFNDRDTIRSLVEAGVPEINQAYMGKVLEMGQMYSQIAKRYPKIGQYIQIYHPDLQGPMDICEVIWGASLFFDLYDEPELVIALLEIATETYMRCMDAWNEIVPPRKAGNAHWGLFHKGTVMIRDDSAMNMSRDMFDTFIRPYDQRLLDRYGGGAIHFCGKGDHYAPSLAEMEGLYAINMSQPEYNEMETIYRHTVDKGLTIIGLQKETAEVAVAQGRDLHGRVHCH